MGMADDPRGPGGSLENTAAASASPSSFATEPRTPRLALRYIARALRLRCPGCGQRPIFAPARRVRGLGDWFQPLDGCPRCGYAYEREDGYFLFAIFGINFGFAVFVAVVNYLLLDVFEIFGPVSIWTLTLSVALPIPLVNFFVARHAKALWIALDQFFDPQMPASDEDSGGWWDGFGDGDDDGNIVPDGAPAGGSGMALRPEPAEAEQPAVAAAAERREPALV
jgi:uncharacterized protein (DUF983 family)